MTEQQRRARITCELWVFIAGVDTVPVLRQGNLSLSGVYFEMVGPVDELGTVQLLQLASHDQAQRAEMLARLIRTVTVDDHRLERPIHGVAFAFLPVHQSEMAALEALAQHVVQQEMDREIPIEIDPGFSAEVERGEEEARPARVHRLSIRRMVLETRWPVAAGETLHVEFESREARTTIPFRGEVVAVTTYRAEGRDTYRAEVRIDQAGAAQGQGAGPFSSDTVSSLFEELISRKAHGKGSGRRGDLKGELDRIPLTSMLGLLETERMTGELRLSRKQQRASLTVSEGRLVDVELDETRPPPERVVAELLTWKEWRFEFFATESILPEGVGTSITALLLELARQQDERARA
jgi:hypothetical protein